MTKKGTSTVAEYINHMKALGDEMTSAGKPFIDDDMVSYILVGLDFDYMSYVSSVCAHTVPIKDMVVMEATGMEVVAAMAATTGVAKVMAVVAMEEAAMSFQKSSFRSAQKQITPTWSAFVASTSPSPRRKVSELSTPTPTPTALTPIGMLTSGQPTTSLVSWTNSQ